MPAEDRPRFFGGFSFLDRPARGERWEGFPSAGFVLPRILLEGDGGRLRLIVQGVESDEGHGLDEEADRFATLLAKAPPSEALPRAGDAPGVGRGVERPDREEWERAVRKVLRTVEAGEVRKAVLARILDVDFPDPVDSIRALRCLREENPDTHVFYFEPRPGGILLGAAPETLALVQGNAFSATAVAGSVRRGGDAAEDATLAKYLLSSGKDREEHRLTAEEMAEILAPRLEGLRVEEEPRVLPLARIQHLETVLRGRLRGEEDVLSLVEVLHPTPAVCGRPREAALALIREAEPFDRGWYAGPVGWFDPAGDGHFVPALRSAVGTDRSWRLFAGAGVVSGSVPDSEWRETRLKFDPALRALEAASATPSATGPSPGDAT